MNVKSLLLVALFAAINLPIQAHANADAQMPNYIKENETVTATKTFTALDIPFCQRDDVTCTEFEADEIEQTITCNGNITNSGGWSTTASPQSCFTKLTYCYDQGTETEECITIDNTDADTSGLIPTHEMTIAPYDGNESNRYTLCDDTDLSSDGSYKEYCIFPYDSSAKQSIGLYTEKRKAGTIYSFGKNDDGTLGDVTVPEDDDVSNDIKEITGLTGNTGDSMLKIAHDGAGVFEYMDADADERLRIIERSDNTNTNDMMIPLGPKSTLTDYKAFLSTQPTGVSVSNACYPMKATMTCDLTPPPACGQHHALSFLFKPQGDGLCRESTASAVTLVGGNGGLQYQWTCSDDVEEPEAPAKEPTIDGVCGDTRNSCLIGDLMSGSGENDTHYTWSCDLEFADEGAHGEAIEDCSLAKPHGVAVNGVCGSSSNTCNAGTFDGDPDNTDTQFLWTCHGSNGGTTADCSADVPAQCSPTRGQCLVGTNPDGNATHENDGLYEWDCIQGDSKAECTDQESLTCQLQEIENLGRKCSSTYSPLCDSNQSYAEGDVCFTRWAWGGSMQGDGSACYGYKKHQYICN